MRLISPDARPRLLAATHPNVGHEVAYRARLDRLVTRMHNSVAYWVCEQYRNNPPTLADDPSNKSEMPYFDGELLVLDASPAADFIKALRGLGRRWRTNFNSAAEELGKWFAQSAASRSDQALKTILKDAGWTVEFRNTATWNEIRQATIAANVSLIKSIGEEHFRQVEQLVMRSVQQGGDLGSLTKALEDRYHLTRKRASLIARDQNNKATAAITRVRQQELGINRAVWLHSNAGKEPRPAHLAFAAGNLGGPIYDVSRGAQIADDGGWTWPGVEINCRCVSRPIIPGL